MQWSRASTHKKISILSSSLIKEEQCGDINERNFIQNVRKLFVLLANIFGIQFVWKILLVLILLSSRPWLLFITTLFLMQLMHYLPI